MFERTGVREQALQHTLDVGLDGRQQGDRVSREGLEDSRQPTLCHHVDGPAVQVLRRLAGLRVLGAVLLVDLDILYETTQNKTHGCVRVTQDGLACVYRDTAEQGQDTWRVGQR